VTQLRLDDWHPGSRPARARRTDAASSHAAADRLERSRHMVGRRAPDLERRGLVVATYRHGDELRWWGADSVVPGTAGEVRRK